MNQPFCLHLIVEEHGGQWTAWVKGEPEIGYGGEWPADAIRRLLRDSGWDEFNPEEIVSVDASTREGHLEFLIPSSSRWQYPVEPSLN